jgi:hypothetical protein
MRFFSHTLFVLAVSVILPSALAAVTPLAKRHYTAELKEALGQIDVRWKNIEKQITGIPKQGASKDDFRVRGRRIGFYLASEQGMLTVPVNP